MNRQRKEKIKLNTGSTLVEMIIAFALLGIFLVASASIISMITGIYYRIKAETYSKQISDIVLEKVASEIEGAAWKTGDLDNPKIVSVAENKLISQEINDQDKADAAEESPDGRGSAIILYDKTDTRVMLYAENKELIVHYFEIYNTNESKRYSATDWKLQSSLYNGFTIEDLTFVRGGGNNLSAFLASKVDGSEETQGSLYGISSVGSYGDDVIVIFLHMNSERYGDYYTYRFVRMYNVE